jgi:asparagine synthase (glutamine-hydrolysing)
MCGIAGIYQPPAGHDLPAVLKDMGAALAHRGPDATGYLRENPMWMVHTRLSIIDTSPAGNQPMSDHSGRYVIIYNGELYNYRELRAELPGPWKSGSDTEVILAAYAAWGPECLHRFNGMFAFAIYDRTTQKLFIARDRLGIKPLYFYAKGSCFAFASEVRTLLQLPWMPRRIDKGGLINFLSYQTVYGESTLVEQVSMLGPGQYMEVTREGHSIGTFWSLFECATEEALSLDTAGIQKRVRELLSRAVARRMVSDVPIGAFLSGGIDSSAIVALMAQASEQPIDTFSVGFEDKRFDESPWSRMIAQKYNTRHHPILLKPSDFLDELPNALAAMDHPSGDGLNSYVVSKLTRAQGVKVALSGLGGDELFGGYPIFHQLPEIQNNRLLWALPFPFRKFLRKVYLALRGGRRAGKVGEVLRLQGPHLESIYKVFRTIYEPRVARELVNATWANTAGEILARESANMERLPMRSKISVAEIATYTQNVLLRDTDQMSMAHALEVRVPFFDHNLIKFVLGVPDKHKPIGSPKQLLVDSLGDLLPYEVVHRPKMGFVFPWEHWLRHELRGFCEQRIRRLQARGLIQADQLGRVWKEFQEGKGPWLWTHIWLPVVLEEWMEANGIEQ